MYNKSMSFWSKKNLKLFNILTCIVLVQLLSACSTNDNTETSDTLMKNNDDNKNLVSPKEDLQFSSLIINHKCIGCGRCAITDPEHFIQYSRQGKAVVKSQGNLTSGKISQAIKICPTKSIKLI